MGDIQRIEETSHNIMLGLASGVQELPVKSLRGIVRVNRLEPLGEVS